MPAVDPPLIPAACSPQVMISGCHCAAALGGLKHACQPNQLVLSKTATPAGERVHCVAADMQAVACFAGFDAAMFSFYSLVPFVLQWSGVAVLNLSLLSSDLWAGAARAILFGG